MTIQIRANVPFSTNSRFVMTNVTVQYVKDSRIFLVCDLYFHRISSRLPGIYRTISIKSIRCAVPCSLPSKQLHMCKYCFRLVVKFVHQIWMYTHHPVYRLLHPDSVNRPYCIMSSATMRLSIPYLPGDRMMYLITKFIYYIDLCCIDPARSKGTPVNSR